MPVINGKLETFPLVYNDVTMADERLRQPSTGAGAAASTQVAVSAVAGVVSVAQNSTTWEAQLSGRVRAQNSTIGDFLAQVAQNSTTWETQISGRVRAQNSTITDLLASVQQNSTTWAVQVDGRVRAQNSTIGDLLAQVAQNSTTWEVQISGRVRAQNSTIGDLLASVQQNSSVWQVQPGSTNWPKAAGLSVDSSNAQNVKLDGSTVLSVQQNSSVWQVQAGSTAFIKNAGLSVDSSNALNIKVDGSTLLTVQPNSTAFIKNMGAAVDSSNFQKVKIGNSTRTVIGSTASENVVTAQLFDSTGRAIETSTIAASSATSTARGIVTRPAIPQCTSVGVRLGTAGDNTLISSAANSIYVYAVSFSAGLGSTGPSTGSSGVLMRFQNGTTSAALWTFEYQFSSLGADQNAVAVSPPAYLFRSDPANMINVHTTSSGGYVSAAAWRE